MQRVAQLMGYCLVVMCKLQFAQARQRLTAVGHSAAAGSLRISCILTAVLISAAGGRAREQASSGAQAEAAAVFQRRQNVKCTEVMTCRAANTRRLPRLHRVGTRLNRDFVGAP